jgi:hypothetical protein
VEKLPNKVTGSDGILAKFVNQFITALLSSLIFLMNLSINTLVFPTAWKIARVSALHKSGSRNDCGNYRPVSVLPIVGQLTASAFDFDRSDGQSHGQKSKILSAVKVTFTNFSCGQS